MALSGTRLTFADGSVLENASCGGAENSLWCWISGKSMGECFAIFSDPEKTKEITVLYNTMGIRYKGYTDLQVIRKGTDVLNGNTIDVRLCYPEGGEHSVEQFDIPKETEQEAAV